MSAAPATTNAAEQPRVLGVFAKRPVAGAVKTRLAAQTSPAWAAQVAEAFLRDTVDKFAMLPVRRMLAFAPVDAEEWFAGLVQGRFILTPQREGDLGRRMAHFFAERFENGAETVVLVGADSPTLPTTLVEQAFAELEQADVVLGPATDGGYYLVGCRQRVPPIFADMTWSSESVLTATIARLENSSWRLAVLPPWYDVDTLSDWHMLLGHLAALRRAGIDPGLANIDQLASGGRQPPVKG